VLGQKPTIVAIGHGAAASNDLDESPASSTERPETRNHGRGVVGHERLNGSLDLRKGRVEITPRHLAWIDPGAPDGAR
jgi:hypothetical protein